MGLKTVVLNSERMNYDGKLDLSVLSSEVKEYASTEQDQILERVRLVHEKVVNTHCLEIHYIVLAVLYLELDFIQLSL